MGRFWSNLGKLISGCIDPLANNYNSEASFDDGVAILKTMGIML